MGECYKEHKLGTCDHLMYITRDEVEKFSARGSERWGMAKYLRLESRFTYRFPREFDQAYSLRDIDKRSPFDYIRIEVSASFSVPHRAFAQVHMTTVSGWEETMNLQFCPAAPENAAKLRPIRYCGWSTPFSELYKQPVEIVGNKYTAGHPDGYTIFRCPVCDSYFMCDEKEIEDVIKPTMLKKGLKYEAGYLKPFYPEREEEKIGE